MNKINYTITIFGVKGNFFKMNTSNLTPFYQISEEDIDSSFKIMFENQMNRFNLGAKYSGWTFREVEEEENE